jgi:hypothetical protein
MRATLSVQITVKVLQLRSKRIKISEKSNCTDSVKNFNN